MKTIIFMYNPDKGLQKKLAEIMIKNLSAKEEFTILSCIGWKRK